jgi:hypothetical protein
MHYHGLRGCVGGGAGRAPEAEGGGVAVGAKANGTDDCESSSQGCGDAEWSEAGVRSFEHGAPQPDASTRSRAVTTQRRWASHGVTAFSNPAPDASPSGQTTPRARQNATVAPAPRHNVTACINVYTVNNV